MGILLPYVVSPVAVAIIFGSLFGDRYGLINELLNGLEQVLFALFSLRRKELKRELRLAGLGDQLINAHLNILRSVE